MLLIGRFMAILDATIVTVAAPVMREDLDASGADLNSSSLATRSCTPCYSSPGGWAEGSAISIGF